MKLTSNQRQSTVDSQFQFFLNTSTENMYFQRSYKLYVSYVTEKEVITVNYVGKFVTDLILQRVQLRSERINMALTG